MNFYIYVGKFKESEDSKETAAKLNQCGYKATLYNLSMYYALRVSHQTSYTEAYRVQVELRNKGFEAFILNV